MPCHRAGLGRSLNLSGRPGPAERIEAYLARWLRESEPGRLMVEGLGGLEAAMDAMSPRLG
jgi:hypothetical protein